MSNSINSNPFDKSSIADLIAKFGSSSATAWLEFERYKIWQPAEDIPGSEFRPVQGFMQKDPYIFAWGNPLVSSPKALLPTAQAFVNFVRSMCLQPVWACVDHDLEEVLGGDEFGWSVVSCIYEDVIDPAHLLELTSPDAKGREGAHVVKDLKKNLSRAEKYEVTVEQVQGGVSGISEDDKKVAEKGIGEWKAHRDGLQIASASIQPWIDGDHRRYWLARKGGEAVGILILTLLHGGSSWQIKNAISFPDSPKGTSEALIYHAIKDLHKETQQEITQTDTNGEPSANGSGSRNGGGSNPVSITFGISAADKLDPVHNLGGWRVNMLSKTYGKVVHTAGLLRRGNFRSKFDSTHESMYVCYQGEEFGLDGVNALLKVLKK